MNVPTDNESWLIDAGDTIIQKKSHEGIASLTLWEMLVYCLWVADYGMRNAGDLGTSADAYADFQSDGRRAADALLLRLTREAFSLDPGDLEREYYDRFDSICHEIRRAEPHRGEGS